MDQLCSALSARTGENVDITNLHHVMRAAFGDFASATTLKSLGILGAVIGGGGAAMGAAGGIPQGVRHQCMLLLDLFNPNL